MSVRYAVSRSNGKVAPPTRPKPARNGGAPAGFAPARRWSGPRAVQRVARTLAISASATSSARSSLPVCAGDVR